MHNPKIKAYERVSARYSSYHTSAAICHTPDAPIFLNINPHHILKDKKK
jgi:hypothetical protein